MYYISSSSLFLLLFSFQFVYPRIIKTSLGRLEGKQSGKYQLFRRIPFAKPPIGTLRFQKPESAEKWNGVWNATEYGPACMSNSTWTQSPQKWVDEDCLHVNIFTSDKCLKSKDCAVVVYIHGGEIVFDSAVMFNDTFLLESFVKQDVILVIPAFRLGIFSHFTVHDQNIAPNNLALYDIILAQEFVKSEIHNFGGDIQKITLFGHSYGGTIASMMAFSSEINQDLSLFQRIIVMSANQYFDTLEEQIERSDRVVKHAGCSVPTNLARKMNRSQKEKYMMKCLQKLSGMELLSVQRSLEEAGYPDIGNLVLRGPLFPDVTSLEMLESPKMIPMLAGCTKFESDDEDETHFIGKHFGLENPIECDEKYRKDLENGIFDRQNHSDKTQAIMVPTKLRVDQLRKHGVPAYLYEFTYPKHAFHTDDLYYIMGIHPFEKDENEEHLEKVYRNMLINFIKFGEPGMGFEMSDLNESTYFEIYWNETTGQKPRMRKRFEENITNYWLKEMMEYDRNITKAKKNQRSIKPVFKTEQFYVKSLEKNDGSHEFIGIIIVLIIFLVGFIAGRYCCENGTRNMYIRLDGDNYEVLK
ncbi:Carboxylesterase type B domain-containing protein [Caenorhabditis elegans]|uniref:Carboxylesterase type B domain-containing protein n=1 Tax=Caenorhabditis elegans TaxID=6239 RepID=Q17542_CAEEL|nr:Carboxylesterase type B domain-containing protein [Caenorhabditis elegans]CCD62335.2 Carboxylesterase type B domain-containing protein [Caenorhabditis elegans]|eukprot:NP_501021.3 Uncharacterized protein CELE_C01B10.10 [Caenorhabditis elegans]